jgi:hypothetical protein
MFPMTNAVVMFELSAFFFVGWSVMSIPFLDRSVRAARCRP